MPRNAPIQPTIPTIQSAGMRKESATCQAGTPSEMKWLARLKTPKTGPQMPSTRTPLTILPVVARRPSAVRVRVSPVDQWTPPGRQRTPP